MLEAVGYSSLSPGEDVVLFTLLHVLSAISQEHGYYLFTSLLLLLVLLYFYSRACLALLLSQGRLPTR